MRAFPAVLLGWLALATLGVIASHSQGIVNPTTDASRLITGTVPQARLPVPTGSNTIFQAKTVNLAATGDAATIAIPASITRYQIIGISVTNCSATPVLAQAALYTGAGATGTNLVAATVITGATGPTVVVALTLAGTVGLTMLTATPLYINVVVANATALTCDIGIRLQDWT